MKNIAIKDFMIPISDYPKVSLDATLREAVEVLEQAHKKFQEREYKPRAVLVDDENGKVVGKISLWHALRALEPKYTKIADFDRLSHWGLDKEFVKSMVRNQGLWSDPLNSLCQAAASMKVKDIMHTLEEDEIIEQESSLSEAIHCMIVGRYLSLLVKDQDKTTGLLRLCDLFSMVSQNIKSCPI